MVGPRAVRTLCGRCMEASVTQANERGTATYEGRLLPRPGEEVVDQGLGFDVATLLGRRQMLRAFGLGAVTVGLAACGASTSGSAASTG